jgi:hypothetical protein
VVKFDKKTCRGVLTYVRANPLLRVLGRAPAGDTSLLKIRAKSAQRELTQITGNGFLNK